MENFLLILLGALLGGVFVSVYLKKSTSNNAWSEPVERATASFQEQIEVNTSPKDAINTIIRLHKVLNEPNSNMKALVRKSYALDFKDFYQIIEKYDLINIVKMPDYKRNSLLIRIYPILKNDTYGDHLSLLIMVEKEYRLLWDSRPTELTKPQIEIQDQVLPCPIICPGSGDFFTENEWKDVIDGKFDEIK